MNFSAGDTYAKKQARYRFWLNAVRTQGEKFQRAKYLVLAGPEACDARVLRVLGVPPENITAVDEDGPAIDSARDLFPGPEYIHGDVLEVAKKKRLQFGGVFLDFCSPLSAKNANYALRVASWGLRTGGVFGVGFMYGREGETTRKQLIPYDMVKRSEVVRALPLDARREHVRRELEKQPALLSRVFPGSSMEEAIDEIVNVNTHKNVEEFAASFQRQGLTQQLMTQGALDLGWVCFNTGFYSYTSSRMVGNKRRPGTPMFYYQGICERPFTRANRGVLEKHYARKVAVFDAEFGMDLIRVDDDPRGRDLRELAVRVAKSSDRRGATQRAADLFCLRTEQVAAWVAVDTRLARLKKKSSGLDPVAQP